MKRAINSNLENLEACLKKGDLKQAEHHLAIANWNAEEATDPSARGIQRRDNEVVTMN